MHYYKRRAGFSKILVIFLFSLAAFAAVLMNKHLHLFDTAQKSTHIPTPPQSPIPTEYSNLMNIPAMESIPVPSVPAPYSQWTVSAPSPTPVLPKTLVVIDPGHGGVDPGVISLYKEGFYEKDIVLDISLKLKTLLEGSEISVLMTRDTDTEVYRLKPYNSDEDVRERPRFANENNATLFVSIHVNSFDTKIKNGDKYNGTEVYYFEKTFGELTSRQFAEIMGNAIIEKVDTNYRGIKHNDFGVLRLSDNPALLIETAFITNKEDHKRLESDEFRMNMAQGIHNGIIEILKLMGAYDK